MLEQEINDNDDDEIGPPPPFHPGHFAGPERSRVSRFFDSTRYAISQIHEDIPRSGLTVARQCHQSGDARCRRKHAQLADCHPWRFPSSNNRWRRRAPANY
ncbi:unnamed protein product, partial [Ectocarpus sp. 12 AP-2014]